MSLAPLEREALGTDAAFADAYECSNATVDNIAASAASAAFFNGGSSFTPSMQTPSMSSFTRAVCQKLTLAGGESESDGWSGSDDDDGPELDDLWATAPSRAARDELGGASFEDLRRRGRRCARQRLPPGAPGTSPQLPITPVVLGATPPAPASAAEAQAEVARACAALHWPAISGSPLSRGDGGLAPPVQRESAGSPGGSAAGLIASTSARTNSTYSSVSSTATSSYSSPSHQPAKSASRSSSLFAAQHEMFALADVPVADAFEDDDWGFFV